MNLENRPAYLQPDLSAWFLVFLIPLLLVMPVRAQDCEPSQTEFHFFDLVIGQTSFGYMDLTNNSDQTLEIEVQVDSPHFSHIGSYFSLQPGETRGLNPRFHPQEPGPHSAIMSLGNDLCADVLLTGFGLARSCAVEPEFLDFGIVELGQTATDFFTIFNDGDVEISVEPGTLSPVIAVLGDPATLQPGESATYEVRFLPNGPGAFSGVIESGSIYPGCNSVHFTGEGEVNMAPGENRVGVFFDTDYTELIHFNNGSAEFLTGYLVLTNPSPNSGVAGWELLPAIEGPAGILSWEIEGQYVDGGLGDQMVIGLAEPLPPSQNVLLASCQIYVAESVGELVSVQLGPVWNPTIPGRMAWLPAGSQEALVMLPFTGVPAVAWIRAGELSPVPDLHQVQATGLVANVPNPFNPSTEIHFTLAQDQNARLRVFDISGRLVRTLLDGYLTAGPRRVVWDGRDTSGRPASSGAYYLRLETAEGVSSRKIMLLK
jgi:hypothetical protein